MLLSLTRRTHLQVIPATSPRQLQRTARPRALAGFAACMHAATSPHRSFHRPPPHLAASASSYKSQRGFSLPRFRLHCLSSPLSSRSRERRCDASDRFRRSGELRSSPTASRCVPTPWDVNPSRNFGFHRLWSCAWPFFSKSGRNRLFRHRILSGELQLDSLLGEHHLDSTFLLHSLTRPLVHPRLLSPLIALRRRRLSSPGHLRQPLELCVIPVSS